MKLTTYLKYELIVIIAGVIFKLDSESIHESLKLSRGDNTVVQHVPAKHANVFGDALLADGCHYWTMQLQQMDPNNGFIAVGKK